MMELWDTAQTWMADHKAVLWGLTVFSVIAFVASLILVPILIARIPADYFLHSRRKAVARHQHPVLLAIGILLKNLFGVILLLAGIAMLVLPGQGLITMAIGISLLNFPGKRRLELWVIRKPGVSRAINWLRARSGKPPLQLPPTGQEPNTSKASPVRSDSSE